MAKGIFPVERLNEIETPFYYYDTELLRRTLKAINDEAQAAPEAQGQGGFFDGLFRN